MAKPNVILILLDDMGWKDLSCCGSEFYETPNIDALAAEGIRFTQAYASCPVCSPSRASILTGKYPARLGVTNFIDTSGDHHPNRGKLVDAPYVRELNAGEWNLARAMKAGGYATWHVGKWHLGGKASYPENQGFDVNFGGCNMGAPPSYFSPYKNPAIPDGPDGEYLTDRLTGEAIKLIRSHTSGSDNPFFLNFCHYAVHTPIQAKDADIRKYQDKARRMGLEQLKTFEEGDFFPCDHKKDQRIQRRLVQSDPVYAAMIENLDWNTGRLMEALKETGQDENTVIIFTSDNGGLATAEGSPTCNAPLAEGKGWMYEGGTREPLIVYYPGLARQGSLCDAITTSPDLYPTILDLAGLPPIPQQHVDGVSLLPALKGSSFDRGPIFWHYPHYGNQGGTPGCSVREGDWKLIEFFEDSRLELYNLVQDPGENTNLAEADPAKTRELHQKLAQWQQSVCAKIPLPNPDYCGSR